MEMFGVDDASLRVGSESSSGVWFTEDRYTMS